MKKLSLAAFAATLMFAAPFAGSSALAESNAPAKACCCKVCECTDCSCSESCAEACGSAGGCSCKK